MSFLTHNQQRIMDILSKSKTIPTYSEIGEQLDMTKQGVHRNINRLKKLKYIKSKPFVPRSLKVIKTGEDHE